ncbi:radical SAM protein [Microbacterium oleivorans]|uniref:radical SAM protein n=1 Tax=Microbacterium oleivorans TaxID=273677 RepID=UPI001C3F2965|nr:radical SAM protein [Microbacterium oleivorans]
MNLLLDEVEVPERAWSAAPRQVSIALTNACDLACTYCYAPKHRAVLGVESLLGWVRELDLAGALGVGFGGGEPTLYRHLPDVCEYMAENTNLAVTMTTHGLRWNAALTSRLSGVVHFVRVSVDGTTNTYERLRGRSFERLRDSLRLIAADFRWGINTVINEETIKDLDGIASLASEYGAAELLLLPQQPTKTAGGVQQATLRELESWVRRYSGPVPLATSENAEIGAPLARALQHEVGLRSYAHIDATGTVRRSSYAERGVPVDEDGVMAALARLERMGA